MPCSLAVPESSFATYNLCVLTIRLTVVPYRVFLCPLTAIALAGVLSGALMILFSAALIHLLVMRRRAKQQARASASRRLIALDGHHNASSSSSSSSQSDSDLGSLEAAEGDEEKGSRLSLNLTPNQPIFVDVDAGGAQAGLQLLLTPPTPRRAVNT
jgi:hypothetical protein